MQLSEGYPAHWHSSPVTSLLHLWMIKRTSSSISSMTGSMSTRKILCTLFGNRFLGINLHKASKCWPVLERPWRVSCGDHNYIGGRRGIVYKRSSSHASASLREIGPSGYKLSCAARLLNRWNNKINPIVRVQTLSS